MSLPLSRGMKGVTCLTKDAIEVEMRRMHKNMQNPGLQSKEYYPDINETAFTGGMQPASGIQAEMVPPLHWSVDEQVNANPPPVDVLSDNEKTTPPQKLRSPPSSKRSIMSTRFCIDGSEDTGAPMKRNVTDSMRDLDHMKSHLHKLSVESAKMAERDRIGIGHDVSGPVPPIVTQAVMPIHQVGRPDPSIPRNNAVYLPQFGPDLIPRGVGIKPSGQKGFGVTMYHQLSADEVTERKWAAIAEHEARMRGVTETMAARGTSAPQESFRANFRAHLLSDLGNAGRLVIGGGSPQRSVSPTHFRASAGASELEAADVMMKMRGSKIAVPAMKRPVEKGMASGVHVLRGAARAHSASLLAKAAGLGVLGISGSPSHSKSPSRSNAGSLSPAARDRGTGGGGVSSPNIHKLQADKSAPTSPTFPNSCATGGSSPVNTRTQQAPEDLMSNGEIAKRFFGYGREHAADVVARKRREHLLGMDITDQTAQSLNWWEEDAALIRKDPEIFGCLKQLADFYLGEGLTLSGMPRSLEPTVAKLAGALNKDSLQPEVSIGVTSSQVHKIRKMAECMRLLGKKNNNTDARIVSLILKITCTRLLKRGAQQGIQFSHVLKCLQRIAIEVSDSRNHNVDGCQGVEVSPRLIGLFAQLAHEVRRLNTEAVSAALSSHDQLLAPDSMQSIKVLAEEMAKKSDEITGKELYQKAWKAKIDAVFDEMDKDGSGFVSRDELEKMYKPKVADRTKKFLVEEMLERADASGDKRISYAEWICYLSQAESSGKYSIEELQVELGFFLKGTGASRLESLGTMAA
ncbi:unnamed protein product [Amoebophrya sp. A25]|nr:unnamed protein product [Amoebophrya sp. A25]|eukprot:GSA25T00020824001.1